MSRKAFKCAAAGQCSCPPILGVTDPSLCSAGAESIVVASPCLIAMSPRHSVHGSAIQPLQRCALRGDGDPWEPYPLNNPPFPNAPCWRPVAECVFSHMFFTTNGAASSFTCAPSPSAHATHPSFWDPCRPQKILTNRWRSRPATESPHLALRPPWTDPLELKMCHLGSLKRPFSSKNGDSGVLLRTHYLLCFHSKNRILSRLRTVFGHVEARLGALSTASALFYRFFCTLVSTWTDLGAQMGRLKALLCPKNGIGNLRKSLQTAFLSPWGLQVLSRVPTDP